MLPPNNDELDNQLDHDNSVGVNQETARYLQHIESKLYADIETRKRIDSGLLFLSCQVGSASLAWLLFSLQISISIILAMSMILALLPGLIDCGESFHFELSSERWSLSHAKPLVALGKLAIGGVIGWNSTQKIVTEVKFTEIQIQQTYSEIKSSQNTNTFTIPSGVLTPVIFGLGLIAIWVITIPLRKKPNV
ncbi:MAG: hypothetical protein RMZ43_033075 [Nostoc sp. CmiVER01]|uniref:hypothetical protein n=1 Tax=Nostoc sp. CmiVER01 TaxID=3075384 RepID=UPI002AD21A75|nr:hypothetical protein [Nostoc sp. CmiVER01]MDZ8126659.1 hypothetical protein [Nostoc sp. CmiVER01]